MSTNFRISSNAKRPELRSGFLIYQYGFQFFKSGLASATAIVTFLAFLLLIVVQALVMDRRAYYEN